MNKKLCKNIMIFIALLGISACSDFLDVVPEDKILEAQLYSTETGIQNVHNGIYVELASEDLYGRQLTMSSIEILGQQYNIPAGHEQEKLNEYGYAQDNNKKTFEKIWKKAYLTILATNKFVESIDEHNDVISAKKVNILKGEAIAIRAMLHFDMLRLFGPIYKTDDAASSIPYYSSAILTNNPVLPAKDVITKVLEDIELALSLLAEDPILTVGKYNTSLEFDSSQYYANRGLRMNYMAVKSLKARVLLYSGDAVAASETAKEVIRIATDTGFFPWTTHEAATNTQNPDRIFSSENFFSLSDNLLYLTQEKLFDYNLNEKSIYVPLQGRLAAVFENDANDPRYSVSWKIPTTGGKNYRTFFKYSDVDDKNKSFRLQIPMFKLSEMYLIAAETEATPESGLSFLNTLRNNRELPPKTADLAGEILKEYRKEFIGEGQLFYYYKRNNTVAIPNGSLASGNINMGPLQYVVPLPDSEINFQ